MTHRDTDYSVPLWQVIFILIALPLFYIGKDQFNVVEAIGSLLPTRVVQLSDRHFFVPYWSIVLALHWLSLGCVFYFLHRNNQSVTSIGLNLPFNRYLLLFCILTSAGIGLYLIREYGLKDQGEFSLLSRLNVTMTTNSFERRLYIFIALSAGFCEEIIYRGFAIKALQARGVPLYLALVIPSISFSLMHGIGNLGYSLLLFGGRIALGLLFLLRKTLTPCIIIHSMFNLSVILVE